MNKTNGKIEILINNDIITFKVSDETNNMNFIVAIIDESYNMNDIIKLVKERGE